MTSAGSSTATGAIAWSGATAFLGSLIFFGYCYLFDFDRRVPVMTSVQAATVDVLLFTVFALHHSLLARSGAKQALQRLLTTPLERSLYSSVASALFVVVCVSWQAVPGVLYELDGLARVVAIALQAVAVVMTVQASRALDALDLAGVRPFLNARAGLSPRRGTLRTSGLYAVVRHPLYSAWLLFVFATPSMTATRAVFAVVSGAYLALALVWEERGLAEAFGAEYDAYRARVRWRMIPYLY